VCGGGRRYSEATPAQPGWSIKRNVPAVRDRTEQEGVDVFAVSDAVTAHVGECRVRFANCASPSRPPTTGSPTCERRRRVVRTR